MAGNTILSILAKLGLDASDFKKGLGEAEGSAKSSASNIGSSLSGIGKDIMKVGGVMTASMTLPIVAFGTSAASAASDLEESMNKVNVVFGDTADEIVKFSETSASSMGLSQQATLAYAGTFGNLFSAMGIGIEQNAEMSTGLVQLAADLASFNNIDPTEALDKLRAGIVGETEPLRTLGVNLTAATVEAKALAMGLGDTEGNFTAAELATARYALILEQTSLAQGDFARTSEGLANQQRIAAAEFENLKATLGQELIPMLSQLISNIIPLIQKFNELDPATRQNIVAALAVVAALGPVVSIIGTLTTVIGGAITAFSAGGAAATAFGAVGTFLTGTVLPGLGAAIAAIGLPVIALIAAIGLLIFVIVKFGKDAWNTMTMVSAIMRQVASDVANWIGGQLVGAFNAIASAINAVIGWVRNLAAVFATLQIPDWLTPGSPTPFELGLKGIANEMAGLVNTELPQFTAGLQFETDGMPLTAAVPTVNPQSSRDEFSQGRDVIDYDQLARVLRDAIMQVVG